MFVAGVLIAGRSARFWAGGRGIEALRPDLRVLMALGFAWWAFWMITSRVVKKRNLGLTAMQKIVMQLAIRALPLCALSACWARPHVWIPF
jgi:uncharacterized membrane protein (DUF4010 family)